MANGIIFLTKCIQWSREKERVVKCIEACSTDNLKRPEQTTRSERICSIHFLGGNEPRKTYPDPVPYDSIT